MVKIHNAFLLILLLFCLITTTSSYSFSAKQQNSIDEIINIGFDDIYPYAYINDNNEAAGIIIDDWRAWAKENNKQPNFIFTKQMQAKEKLTKSKIDVFANYNLNKPDSELQAFKHNKKHYLASCYIYVHQDLLNIKNINDLLPYSIGAEENFEHVQSLQAQYKGVTFRTYKNIDALYEAITKKELVAFVSGERLAKGSINEKLIHSNFPNYKRLLYEQDELVALTHTKPFLLSSFDAFISQSKQSKKQATVNDSLQIVFSDNHPPYSFSNKITGRPEGLFIDIFRLWASHYGKEITFVREQDIAHLTHSEHIINQFKENAIVIDSHKDTFLGEQLALAFKLYRQNIKLYVSINKPNIRQPEQLSNHRIGITEHLAHIQAFSSSVNQDDLVVFSSYEKLFEAAKNQQVDAFYGVTESVDYLLSQQKETALFYSLISDLKTDVFLHVNSKNNALVDVIQRVFTDISFDKLIALEQKWLSGRAGYFNQQLKAVNLNSLEKAWLLKQQKIKIGMVNNWRPMEFLNKEGQLAGINVDLFKLIESRLEVDFSYQIYPDWQTLIKAIENKEVDMIASVAPDDDKRYFLNFSQAYWRLPWAIVHPVVGGSNTNLSAFKGQRVAVIKGVYLNKVLAKQFPDIQVVSADNIDHAFYLLQKGEVAAVIANLAPASDLLKRESLIQMGLSTIDNLPNDEQHIATRNDWPFLGSIIEKALNTISETDKKIIYNQWLNLEITHGIEKGVVINIAVQIGVLTLLIISIIIFWNRRLYIEVKERKKLEQKMKYMATHDELTGLANRTLLTERISTAIHYHKRQRRKLAVLFIDLDGFKHVNDKYGHDVGDELLKSLTDRLKDCVRDSDTVARFGGDEFVLLLTGLNKKEEASFIAEKVIKVINLPVKLSAALVNVGCSIGISSFPDDGDTDIELLKVADTMMYHVKDHGKNNYKFS